MVTNGFLHPKEVSPCFRAQGGLDQARPWRGARDHWTAHEMMAPGLDKILGDGFGYIYVQPLLGEDWAL